MSNEVPFHLEIAAAIVYLSTWSILCFAVWHLLERRSESARLKALGPEFQLDPAQLEFQKFADRLALWTMILGIAASIFVSEILCYKARGII